MILVQLMMTILIKLMQKVLGNYKLNFKINNESKAHNNILSDEGESLSS